MNTPLEEAIKGCEDWTYGPWEVLCTWKGFVIYEREIVTTSGWKRFQQTVRDSEGNKPEGLCYSSITHIKSSITRLLKAGKL